MQMPLNNHLCFQIHLGDITSTSTNTVLKSISGQRNERRSSEKLHMKRDAE